MALDFAERIALTRNRDPDSTGPVLPRIQEREDEEKVGILKGIASITDDEQEVENVAQSIIPTYGKALVQKQQAMSLLKERTLKVPDIDDLDLPSSGEGIDRYDIVDFLFGPEMAIAGVKYDTEGIGWDFDIARQQWSEAPLWQNLFALTSLVGTVAFPAVKAATTSLRFGKLGTLMGKFGDKAVEIQKFKEMGALGPEVTEVSEATLKKLRLVEHAKSKYSQLQGRINKAEKAKAGEEGVGLTVFEKARLHFDKRFANNYYKIAEDVDGKFGVKFQFANTLQKLWKEENIGKLFVDIPDADKGADIYRYLIKKNDPNIGILSPTLDQKTKTWADNIFHAKTSHQKEALEEGLIDEDTFKRIGGIHLPALRKGTPEPEARATKTFFAPVRTRKPVKGVEGVVEKGGKVVPGEEFEYVAFRTWEHPRLDLPQTYFRKKNNHEIVQELGAGKLITDPADLTFRGYVMDRMLLNNFKAIRELALDPKYAVSADDIITKYGSREAAEAAGYISLDYIPGSAATIKRMIKKKGGKLGTGESLPYIQREVFDEIFGESGMFAQTAAITDLMEAFMTIHKTSKTGFSIPTHLQNIVGNFGFLMQAGFNPFSRSSVKLMHESAGAFRKWSELHVAAKKAGIDPRTLLDPKSGKLKGVNFGKIKVRGQTFDLNEELLDPMVRDLIEESAFELAEGFGHLERMLGRLSRDQHMTRGVIKSFMKIKENPLSKKIGVSKLFDTMTKSYLAEDMVPKMAYYLDLRGQGFSKQWAALEVGRRLPMYSTVGSTIRKSRRWVFPWLTFPAEAMRITKNNIMDHPLRMMPWLQMPNLMQAGMAMLGETPGGREAVEEARKQLPAWAQTPTTVVTTERGAQIGGAVAGALAGGTVGTVLGGPLAAAFGALAGGAATGIGVPAVQRALQGDKPAEDRVRGAVLNWLPHSSFILQNTSPDLLNRLHEARFVEAQRMLPAEPFAILRPFIEILSGQTQYGQPIGAENIGDEISKAVAGVVGFLAPPWIQKYGFKTTTPDLSASEAILGKKLPGDITNISRLLVETGQAVDPITGKPGNFTLDTVINNLGFWRSYPAYAETQLANEAVASSRLSEIRGHLWRNLDFFMKNNNQEGVNEILRKIFVTYTKQYLDNPGMAQNKFDEDVKRRIKDIGKHPRLRQYSEEELLLRFKNASDLSTESRIKAREEYLKAIKDEIMIRRRGG